MEDLVDRDAREKSDAAREAFLAELAQDAKKNANKGNDTKHAHEKSKEKRKNKDNRKSKDQKVFITRLLKFLVFPVCHSEEMFFFWQNAFSYCFLMSECGLY